MRLPQWLLVIALVGLVAAVFAGPTTLVGSAIGLREVMAAVVTLIVLAAALYVILSKQYGDPDVKWAYGAVGTVLGYWLRVTQGT